MSSNERVIAGDRFNGVLMSYTTYYVGTCLVPSTGKFDRKRFTGSRGEALSDWNAWCEEVRESDLAERRRGVSRHVAPPSQRPAAGRGRIAADNPQPRKSEEPTAMRTANEKPSKSPSKVYVVQVVGGPAIYYADDFDVAAAVCDGLAAGAKASGFAAAYDVVEVKRWGA